MDLVSIQAIHDLDICLFHSARIFNVVFLIKACFEFNHDLNRLAVFTCFNQTFNNLGVMGYTIQGNADGYNIRIICGFLQESKEWFHTFVWIGDQSVLFTQLFKDGSSIGKLRRILRHKLWIKQICTVSQHVLNLIEILQIHRHAGDEYCAIFRINIVFQCT